MKKGWREASVWVTVFTNSRIDEFAKAGKGVRSTDPPGKGRNA
jgi:recombinational DNA repair protein (RecF pathway)